MLLPSLYLRVALNVGGLGEDANEPRRSAAAATPTLPSPRC